MEEGHNVRIFRIWISLPLRSLIIFGFPALVNVIYKDEFLFIAHGFSVIYTGIAKMNTWCYKFVFFWCYIKCKRYTSPNNMETYGRRTQLYHMPHFLYSMPYSLHTRRIFHDSLQYFSIDVCIAKICIYRVAQKSLKARCLTHWL
jgi:hypothetical protein